MKIVINKCYGGFSLSHAATELRICATDALRTGHVATPKEGVTMYRDLPRRLWNPLTMKDDGPFGPDAARYKKRKNK